MSRLAERHHGKPCGYCSRPMDKNSDALRATRDHSIPRSKGGTSSPKIICCHKCNGLKGDMLPDEWAAYMRANPRWWLLTHAERRASRRADRDKKRVEKWGARLARRDRERQGSPLPGPVVVPPELIYRPIPIAESLFILKHGKKAYRAAMEAGEIIAEHQPIAEVDHGANTD